MLSSFYCSGNEPSLLDCDFSAISYSCDQYDIAGVSCEGNALCVVHVDMEMILPFQTAPCTDGVKQFAPCLEIGKLNYVVVVQLAGNCQR